MGVSDFLGKVLSSAGNEVDLREYREGILVPTSFDTNHRKRRKTSSLTNANVSSRKRQCCKRRRRPLRIAVDVSHWIYKACHRFGPMLADEKHLTNYGRYQLVRNHNNNNNGSSTDENNDDNQPSPSEQTQPDKTQHFNQNNRRRVNDETTNNGMTMVVVDPEMERRYITSCCLFVMERLQSLQQETNAEMLVVLDGATPPIKQATVKRRSEARKESVRLRDAPINIADVSRPTLSSSNHNNDCNTTTTTSAHGKENQQGNNNLQNTTSVVEQQLKERLKANRRAGAGNLFSQIIEELIMAMRINQISFLVAPYEADGQLAWLSKERLVDLIVTEDSDLVASGATCILYKMDISTPAANCTSNTSSDNTAATTAKDKENGDDDNNNNKTKTNFSFVPKGKLLLKDSLGAVTISKYAGANGRNLTLRDMSDAVLAVMFVAAGSDYCDSLKGIGLVTACEIVQKSFLYQNKLPPLAVVFESLFQRTHDRQLQGDLRQQEEYKEKFLAALLMYRHPVVYSPFARQFIIAGGYDGDPELMSYAPYRELLENSQRRSQIVGNIIKGPMSTLIAEGWVSARTKLLYEFAKGDNKLPEVAKHYFGLHEDDTTISEKSEKKPAQVDDIEGQTTKRRQETNADDDNSKKFDDAESNDGDDNSRKFHDADYDGTHIVYAPTTNDTDVGENELPDNIDGKKSSSSGAEDSAKDNAELKTQKHHGHLDLESQHDSMHPETQEEHIAWASGDSQLDTQSNEGLYLETQEMRSNASYLSPPKESQKDTQCTTQSMLLETQEAHPTTIATSQGGTQTDTQSNPGSMHFETQEPPKQIDNDEETALYSPGDMPSAQQPLSEADEQENSQGDIGEVEPQTQPEVIDLSLLDTDDDDDAIVGVVGNDTTAFAKTEDPSTCDD